jgi:hypothetical protein
MMRLVLRIAGTWLLGLAVVLLVIDGTRSLGANRLVLSSLEATWNSVNPASLLIVRGFFEGLGLPDGVMTALLSYPAFAVVGVPGILLAVLGRVRRRERYIQQDQI